MKRLFTLTSIFLLVILAPVIANTQDFGVPTSSKKANVQTPPVIKKEVVKPLDKKAETNKGLTKNQPTKYFPIILPMENDAMKLMIELHDLKQQLNIKIQDAILEKVIGKKQKQPETKNPWQFNSTLADKKVTPAWSPEISALSAKIAEKEKQLTNLEHAMDLKYIEFLSLKKTYQSFPGSEEDKDFLKTFLLYMATTFRRGIGQDLHTDLAGLITDPDCAGDLVSNQPFLKYGVYALDKNYAQTTVELMFIAKQTQCISSVQLAEADYFIFEANEKALANIYDTLLKQRFIELTINPLMIVYDTGKGQYSRGLDYLNEYFELAKKSYDKNTILQLIGFYLVDTTKFSLTEVKFKEGDKVQASNVPNPSTYNPSNITTPFGADTGFLSAKWCLPELTKAMGKQAVSWGQFIDQASNPTFVGFGADSFLNTAAAGMPDLTGICGGGGGGGSQNGGGSFTCSMSGVGGMAGMIKVCKIKAPPIKGPPPVSAGDNNGNSSPDYSTKTISKTISTKGGFLCPSDGKSDPSPAPGDDGSPSVGSDIAHDPATQASIDKGKQQLSDSAEDLAAEGAPDATYEEIQEALADAQAALDSANVVDGLYVVTQNGTEFFVDGDGNVLAEGDCVPCADGATPIGGFYDPSDGTITLEKGAMQDTGVFAENGVTGADVGEHEGGHAFLDDLGYDGNDHNVMGKTGVPTRPSNLYCTAQGDECSPQCNAGQIIMATFYDCPGESSGSMNVSSGACGNAPVMPSGDGGVVCPGSIPKPNQGAGGQANSMGALNNLTGQQGGGTCEQQIQAKCMFAECLEEAVPVCGNGPYCSAGGGGGPALDIFGKTWAGVTDPSPIQTGKLPVWMQEQYKQQGNQSKNPSPSAGSAGQKQQQKK